MIFAEFSRPTPPARVVILGANGVIGRATTQLLRASNVTALPLSSRDVDLTAPDASLKLAALLRPGDAVVVLAALTPDRGRDLATMSRNIDMGISICAALDRCPIAHVIYMSSDAVYPQSVEMIDESSPVQPSEPYAAMHLIRERMIADLVKAPVTILRSTQVAAPNDPHDAYGPNRFRRTAATEGRITLFGNGEETRDHIFVDDVAAVLRLCLMHRSRGVMNVATGRSLSFAEVARIVAAGFRPAPEIVSQPRRMPVTHRRFDVSAFRRAFPGFTFATLEASEENIRRSAAQAAIAS